MSFQGAALHFAWWNVTLDCCWMLRLLFVVYFKVIGVTLGLIALVTWSVSSPSPPRLPWCVASAHWTDSISRSGVRGREVACDGRAGRSRTLPSVAALSQPRIKWNVKPHPQFLSEPDRWAVKPGVKSWGLAKTFLQCGARRILRIYISCFTVL